MQNQFALLNDEQEVYLYMHYFAFLTRDEYLKQVTSVPEDETLFHNFTNTYRNIHCYAKAGI